MTIILNFFKTKKTNKFLLYFINNYNIFIKKPIFYSLIYNFIKI